MRLARWYIVAHCAQWARSRDAKISWECWLKVMARIRKTLEVTVSFGVAEDFQLHIGYVTQLKKQFQITNPEGWRIYDERCRASYSEAMLGMLTISWPNWHPNEGFYKEIFYGNLPALCLQCSSGKHSTAVCPELTGKKRADAPAGGDPRSAGADQGKPIELEYAPCRQYNQQGSCKFEQQKGGCKAKHVCSKCGGTHPASKCAKK